MPPVAALNGKLEARPYNGPSAFVAASFQLAILSFRVSMSLEARPNREAQWNRRDAKHAEFPPSVAEKPGLPPFPNVGPIRVCAMLQCNLCPSV